MHKPDTTLAISEKTPIKLTSQPGSVTTFARLVPRCMIQLPNNRHREGLASLLYRQPITPLLANHTSSQLQRSSQRPLEEIFPPRPGGAPPPPGSPEAAPPFPIRSTLPVQSKPSQNPSHSACSSPPDRPPCRTLVQWCSSSAASSRTAAPTAPSPALSRCRRRRPW
jgi:hypothetical protein